MNFDNKKNISTKYIKNSYKSIKNDYLLDNLLNFY